MSKEELKKLQARNRELQANLRSLYTTAEKEKRELTVEEQAQERAYNQEIADNHREIMMSGDEKAIAAVRENIDRNKQYREYLQAVRQKREDATITLAPKTPADGSSIAESGAINLRIEDIIDTKENGLGRPEGQSFVTGVACKSRVPCSHWEHRAWQLAADTGDKSPPGARPSPRGTRCSSSS